jgi:serine/threonine protein kinase
MDGSTMPGRPVGTASYMAPERILQLPLDPRCDLFSLGVVMYEMATGRLPFAAASPAETVTNILEKEPAPVTALSPNRSGQLDRIIKKLLAKSADDRYPSAAAPVRRPGSAPRTRNASHAAGPYVRPLLVYQSTPTSHSERLVGFGACAGGRYPSNWYVDNHFLSVRRRRLAGFSKPAR